jgi:group I intron endonuclease
MYGYIYLIINLQNGKKYVGQSILFNDLNTYLGSGQVQRAAIKKYGRKFFKKYILGYCSSKEELNLSEKECIAFYCSNDIKYGYNLTEGGEGAANPSEETRQKMAKAAKGNKSAVGSKSRTGLAHSPETKIKIAKNKYGNTFAAGYQNFLGGHHTESAKLKISMTHKGKPKTEEWKNKISAAQIGKFVSEETRKKQSDKKLQYWQERKNAII